MKFVQGSLSLVFNIVIRKKCLINSKFQLHTFYELKILLLLFHFFPSRQDLLFDRIIVLFVNSIYKNEILYFLRKLKSAKFLSHKNLIILKLVQNYIQNSDLRTLDGEFQELLIKILGRTDTSFKDIYNLKVLESFNFIKILEPLNEYFSFVPRKISTTSSVLSVKGRYKYKRLNFDNWRVEIREDFGLEISEAQIFDGSEVVLKQSGEPIMPMWGFMNSHVHISRLDTRVVTIGSDWLCIRKEPISQIPIEGCVSLLSPMSSDFGHFILDLLFRLKHYDQNSDLQKDYPLILLDSSLPDPFFRFLKLLFPSYAFTKVDPGASYTVNRLLLPLPSSLICHDFLLGKAITEGSHFDIEDLEWIHAKIRHSSLTKKIKHGLKIYISRGRNPRWRKLVNEQEIIQNLMDLDFKIIHPEDFSLLELSEFFSRAEVIVFSAGSVTFNLCFANPEASIIILISKGFINDLGKAILTTYYFSNKFKNWFMIQGESSPGRLYTEDYYISTRMLRKTLKKLCQLG